MRAGAVRAFRINLLDDMNDPDHLGIYLVWFTDVREIAYFVEGPFHGLPGKEVTGFRLTHIPKPDAMILALFLIFPAHCLPTFNSDLLRLKFKVFNDDHGFFS